jgi:hypothetical protein
LKAARRKTGDAARFWEHSSDHARQRGAKLGSVPRFLWNEPSPSLQG